MKEDDKEISEAIFNFIGQYNNCLEILNAVLSTKEVGDAVREDLKEKYGLFKREYAIQTLKSKLRRSITSAYKTSSGEALSLLIQVGMSPLFFLGNPNHIDGGKIDFDEEKYKEAFTEFQFVVGELFGYDSDNDNIVDTGCAYELERLLKAYTGPRSVFVSQRNINERRIKDIEQKIVAKEKSVENERDKLHRDFRDLEAAQRQQESMGSWFEALNNQK